MICRSLDVETVCEIKVFPTAASAYFWKDASNTALCRKCILMFRQKATGIPGPFIAVGYVCVPVSVSIL